LALCVKDGNEKALETLPAYNGPDTIILETLLVIAYNLKVKTAPFLGVMGYCCRNYQKFNFRLTME